MESGALSGGWLHTRAPNERGYRRVPVAGLDLQAFLVVYRGAHGALGPLMIALTVLGSGWSALALVPFAWRRSTRRFAWTLAAAIGVQALLVWSLKIVVGRVRPWIALGLPPPIGSPHDPSFPSGHAAGSFCVATFIALALPTARPGRGARLAIGAVVLATAVLVALSRVYLGAHFPGDVLAGALLGGAVGSLAGLWYVADARRRG